MRFPRETDISLRILPTIGDVWINLEAGQPRHRVVGWIHAIRVDGPPLDHGKPIRILYRFTVPVLLLSYTRFRYDVAGQCHSYLYPLMDISNVLHSKGTKTCMGGWSSELPLESIKPE